jgi:hypothetical protein
MREIFFWLTHRVEHLRGPPTWQPGMGVHSRTFTGTKLRMRNRARSNPSQQIQEIV